MVKRIAAILLLLAGTLFAAETYYQIPSPEGSGKKMRTQNQTISTHDVYQQGVLIGDGDADSTAEVNTDQTVSTRLKSAATTIVTSTATLANGASYTTATFDTSLNGHGFTVTAKADQNGHIYHEQSIDNSTWFAADDYIYTANDGHNEEHIAHPRYNRFKFTNDSGSAQGSFTFSVIQRHMDGFGTVKISAAQNEVTQGDDVPWQMEGAKTNNAAVPGTTNLGTLPAV